MTPASPPSREIRTCSRRPPGAGVGKNVLPGASDLRPAVDPVPPRVDAARGVFLQPDPFHPAQIPRSESLVEGRIGGDDRSVRTAHTVAPAGASLRPLWSNSVEPARENTGSPPGDGRFRVVRRRSPFWHSPRRGTSPAPTLQPTATEDGPHAEATPAGPSAEPEPTASSAEFTFPLVTPAFPVEKTNPPSEIPTAYPAPALPEEEPPRGCPELCHSRGRTEPSRGLRRLGTGCSALRARQKPLWPGVLGTTGLFPRFRDRAGRL